MSDITMTARSSKIRTFNELEAILCAARAAGQRIALCHGVFDLLHPGHIVHFKEGRAQGDLLVVTVTPDRFVRKGPGRPLVHERLRLETIAALEDVDYIALNEWPTAVETIHRLQPHVYVKGSDYVNAAEDVTGQIADEERAIMSIGGRMHHTNGETFSSSYFINRFFNNYPEATQAYLQAFRERHSADEVIACLRALADLRVVVVGEAIVDQYCYCFPMGKSPKETIVSTRFEHEESFAGGSLAIANHVAGFCAEVTLLTALGDEAAHRQFIESKLRPNVRLEAMVSSDRPTIIKRRYLEPNFLTKMFEVQYLNDAPIPAAAEQALQQRLHHELPAHDFVVAADFGHGLLTQRLQTYLSSCGKFLALNTQSNSANLGFNAVTKYRRADFVCVDEPELKLAALNRYGDLKALAELVKRRICAQTFLVSRGPHGLLILSDDTTVTETPALAAKILDRTGAGDALFSLTSPCAYRGVPLDVVGFIGNCAGAIAVETVCNREPVDPTLLYKFITSLLK